jgi:hypothetical protein
MKEPYSEKPEATGLSRKRKVVVLIFVIGFWIFFYWFKASQTPSPPLKTSTENQKEISPANP